MKQVLLGNAKAFLGATAIRYASLMGGYSWESSNIYARQIVGTPGTIRNLRVNLSAAPGSGKSRTFTLLKNNVEQSLTVTISDAATQGSDTAHDVSVSAGDRLAIKAVSTNTPATCYANCTTQFEGTVTDESLILGTSRTDLPSTSDVKYAFCAGAYTWNPTLANREEIVSTSGTIKKLYVYVNVAPGAGKSLTFTLMKNGVATSLEVTISGTDKSGSDTVNTVSVSAYDRISLRCTPTNTPNTAYTCWGMVFLADTSGESLVLGGSDHNLSDTSTLYNMLMGSTFWGAEAYVRELLQGVSGYTVTLKNLHVRLSGPPGAGTLYRFTVMKNGVATGLIVAISGTDTQGSNTVDSVTVSDFDEFSLRCVPVFTPTVRDAFWGATILVEAVPPPVVKAGLNIPQVLQIILD